MTGLPSASRGFWAAAADLAAPLGPDGPPSNVGSYLYGGKYTYTWDNYDASYQIQISLDAGDTVHKSLFPGTVEWASGSPVYNGDFYVRHIQGAYESAWAGLF